MVKLQIEKILHEKKITKTAFADMLGIKKQNVNLLLETRNIDKIQEIADALGLNSIASVAQRIDNCVEAGFLEKRPREARSLRVVGLEDNSDTARLFRHKISSLNAQEAAERENPEISESDLSLTHKSVNEQIVTLKKAAKILGIRLQ